MWQLFIDINIWKTSKIIRQLFLSIHISQNIYRLYMNPNGPTRAYFAFQAASDFMVARILFGPVGVSSPPPDSSSLCTADPDFLFVEFFLRAFAVVGDGDGSSRLVLSGIIFFLVRPQSCNQIP